MEQKQPPTPEAREGPSLEDSLELELEDVKVAGIGLGGGEGAAVPRKERSPHLLLADDAAARWGGQCLSRAWGGRELVWRCEQGHVWRAAYRVIVEDYGWCSECPNTGREGKCRVIMEALLGHKFPKVRPQFLKDEETGGRLELDGYSAILNLGFEHQGLQHYAVVPFFHPNGEADLERSRARDRKKFELCEQNKTAVVIIPYYVVNPASWIKRDLQSMGFLPPDEAPAGAAAGPRALGSKP